MYMMCVGLDMHAIALMQVSEENGVGLVFFLSIFLFVLWVEPMSKPCTTTVILLSLNISYRSNLYSIYGYRNIIPVVN